MPQLRRLPADLPGQYQLDQLCYDRFARQTLQQLMIFKPNLSDSNRPSDEIRMFAQPAESLLLGATVWVAWTFFGGIHHLDM